MKELGSYIILYTPDLRPVKGRQLAQYLPYGAHAVASSLGRAAHSDTRVVDLNHAYWRSNESIRRCGSQVSQPNPRPLEEVSESLIAQLDLSKLAEQDALLFSKDFHDIRLSDDSNQLTMRLISRLKRATGKTTILGGSRLKREMAKQIMLRNDDLDLCFYNETWGRANEIDLVRVLMNAKRCDSVVGQFWSRAGGRLTDHWTGPMPISTSRQKIHMPLYNADDVRAYARPASSLLADDRLALPKPTKHYGPVASVRFMDGCVNNCAYCNAGLQGIKMVSPACAAAYLGGLHREHGIDTFFLLNRQLNMGPRYLRSFCQHVVAERLHIRWADSINIEQLDVQDIALLRGAGCIRVCGGLETVASAVRRQVRGELDRDAMMRKLEALHCAGIWVMLNVIVGMPFERESDIAETSAFLEECQEYVQHVYLFRFQLYPQSAMAQSPGDYGVRIADSQETRLVGNSGYSSTAFAFDEIGGRDWKAMNLFADWAFDKIDAVRKMFLWRSVPDDFVSLALLYDQLGSKSDVEAALRRTAVSHGYPM